MRSSLILPLTCVIALSLVYLPKATAEEPAAAAVLKAAGTTGGWVMEVGTTSGSLIADLAKDDRFVVTGVALTPAAAEAARARLRGAGLLGKAHVHEPLEVAKVPAKDGTVSLLVCDLDATKLPRAEVERAVAPLGIGYFKQGGTWQVWKKPWPTDIDNWTHYDYGANSNDASKDQKAGFARGLQWVNGAYGGDGGMGVRLINGIAINPETSASWPESRLVARDAFNGTLLWTRNSPGEGGKPASGMPDSRYAFFADAQRGYILWENRPFMESFNLRTGAPLLTYDQGFNQSEYADARGAEGRKKGRRGEPMKALVSDGKLVQVFGGRIRVLDAATGKLLWKHEAADRAFDNPLVQSGRLVVCEGPAWKHRDSSNYLDDTGLFFTEAVTAFDLATGKPAWSTPNPVLATNPCVRNMASDDGRISVLFEIDGKYDKAKSGNSTTHALVLLMAADGKVVWTQPQSLSNLDQHQKRTTFNNGKVWFIDIKKAIPFDLDTPTSGKSVDNEAFGLNGLWGCTLPRMTPNGITWWLAGESFADGSRSISIAGRNGCDMGSVPAQGLLYLTPSLACGCYGFINIHSAYHHRLPTPAVKAARLVQGSGAPAQAPAGAWPADDAWPMYLRDPRRSSWSPGTVPATPAVAWQVKALPAVPAWASTMDWDQALTRTGAVSAPSVAEGVIALGSYDTQELIVLDAATGTEKWRMAVDGRIDSPPTIYRGVVYAGTRSGWLYACNRDTGALLWRFCAAPTDELIVAMGGSENASPLFGTVMIEDGLVWTAAGRNVELDHGLSWWALDPRTGEVKRSGVLRDEGVWRDEAAKSDKKGKAPALGYRRQAGLNSPLVSDGTHMVSLRAGLKVKTGEPADPGRDFNVGAGSYGGFPAATSQLLVGNYGLLLRHDARSSSSRVGRAWMAIGVGGSHLAYNADGRVLGLNAMHATGGRSVMAESGDKLALFQVPATVDKGTKVAPVWSVATTAGNSKSRWFRSLGVAVAGDKAVALLFTGGDNEGSGGKGLIEIRNLADGSLLSSVPLPGMPVNNGMAIARGAIYVTLDDGSVVCVK